MGIMEKTTLLENSFSCLDFGVISKLLQSSYDLLHRGLELRDPQGKILLSFPQSDIPLYGEVHYQGDFQPVLRSGEIQHLVLDNNQSLVALPIIQEGQFFGSLLVCDHFEDEQCQSWTKLPQCIKFYQGIIDLIAKEYSSQMETFSLSEELALRYEELNLFYKVGEWLGGVQETEESLRLIIEKTTETLEADHGFITLPAKGIFMAEGIFEGCNSLLNKELILKKLGQDLLEVFSANELVILEMKDEEPRLSSYLDPSLQNLVAVPIKLNGLRQGALGICCTKQEVQKKFTTGDVRLLHSMAEVVSILLKNTELYQNLKTFLVNVVKCLVSAIEAKDIYTRGHSERVNAVSLLMADHLNMPAKEKESLNWASMLHDIGKIGIPEAILTKPGKLTDSEWEEIKKHPERGYIILKPIQGFQSSLDGVRLHHERFDGRGYPQGLAGEAIPLAARIIAVADTYDAITSNRAYRKGLSHEQAVNEIRRVAGTQLDPDLVKVFLEMIREKGQGALPLDHLGCYQHED